MQLTTSAEVLIFILTRLYFYSVLLPYETATFQLKSPEKQKIGLHSPDLHKMLISPKARRSSAKIYYRIRKQKNPAFPKKQNDIILILCKHE